jgi:hypothetical protein
MLQSKDLLSLQEEKEIHLFFYHSEEYGIRINVTYEKEKSIFIASFATQTNDYGEEFTAWLRKQFGNSLSQYKFVLSGFIEQVFDIYLDLQKMGATVSIES